MARRMKRSQRRYFEPYKAFTLIEVLVSVTVLSVGIIFVLQAFSAASSILDSTRNITRSSLLLRDSLSEVVLDAEHSEIQTGYRVGRFDKPFEDYRWRIRVDELSSVSHEDLVLKFYGVQAEAIADGTGRKLRIVTRLCTTKKAE